MKMQLTAAILGTALIAGPAMADHQGPAVAAQAKENGTLHPGHVAIYATGGGSVTDDSKLNRPAAEFHITDDGEFTATGTYQSGPGGYATTKRNANANR